MRKGTGIVSPEIRCIGCLFLRIKSIFTTFGNQEILKKYSKILSIKEETLAGKPI